MRKVRLLKGWFPQLYPLEVWSRNSKQVHLFPNPKLFPPFTHTHRQVCLDRFDGGVKSNFTLGLNFVTPNFKIIQTNAEVYFLILLLFLHALQYTWLVHFRALIQKWSFSCSELDRSMLDHCPFPGHLEVGLRRRKPHSLFKQLWPGHFLSIVWTGEVPSSSQSLMTPVTLRPLGSMRHSHILIIKAPSPTLL